jgi:response regulator RpfG family c-di-GMP phosphodiesterase
VRARVPTNEEMQPSRSVAVQRSLAPDELPRMLCVDDEPAALEGMRDVLRGDFQVEVATSGSEGLALLRRSPKRFAVVISDMRMPEMTGAMFLQEARRVAPLTTRMLLTGDSDVESAVRAVNDGQVFRYLTKPCNGRELRDACNAAVWQHRLATAERLLLAELLRGSVEALTDMLLIASPPAFGRGARARELLARLMADIGMEDGWELDVAAMLAHLGAIALPASTASRLYAGQPLTAAETAAAARVPDVSERLVARLPRLEGVLQILRAYQRRFDSIAGTGTLPVGARALRIVLDYAQLEGEGVSPSRALGAMRSRQGAYDPQLLETFAAGLDIAAPTGQARR